MLQFLSNIRYKYLSELKISLWTWAAEGDTNKRGNLLSWLHKVHVLLMMWLRNGNHTTKENILDCEQWLHEKWHPSCNIMLSPSYVSRSQEFQTEVYQSEFLDVHWIWNRSLAYEKEALYGILVFLKWN